MQSLKSEAIRGHQWSSVVIRGTQRHSEALTCSSSVKISYGARRALRASVRIGRSARRAERCHRGVRVALVTALRGVVLGESEAGSLYAP